MDTESLASQLRTLETQLAVIKAQLARIAPLPPTRSFGDLYGLFAGQAAVSEADLDAAKYRFEWDGKLEG